MVEIEEREYFEARRREANTDISKVDRGDYFQVILAYREQVFHRAVASDPVMVERGLRLIRAGRLR